MPFKNKAQMRACYAKKDPNWDCDKWMKETKKKSSGGRMSSTCLRCGGKMKYQTGGDFNPALRNPAAASNLDQLIDWTVLSNNLFQVPDDKRQMMANMPGPITEDQLVQGQDIPYQSPSPISYFNTAEDSTPRVPEQKRNPWDPRRLGIGLRAASTGLGWLSGIVERNRQNKYMYEQFSTLGQIDPVPVQNFQPNAYNLYARYGGKLSKYRGRWISNH